MSVELVFAALLVAASAQLTPYCPDRSAPRDVDSPCNDGCSFLCNQNLCRITRTSASATSVNCGGDAFRPFCGGDTPNPSTDLFCTTGCKFFCRGGAQNSLCTMTLSGNQWSLNCTPLPTKSEQATDCSSSSACISTVGQCSQFSRRCTCFPDGSFQEAGCYRVASGGGSSPTPSQPTPFNPGPTPFNPGPTPFNNPPTPSGSMNCPNDPTCKSYWPTCTLRECVCSSAGVLISSNCKDAVSPTPFQPQPTPYQAPVPYPTPYQPPTPQQQPTPFQPPTPQQQPTPLPAGQQACLGQVCDLYTSKPCTTAMGATCVCNALGNVISKTCPEVQLSPCLLSLPNVKTQCDAFRAQTGSCTTSTGAVCLCNSQNIVAAKSCNGAGGPPSDLTPGGMSTCPPQQQQECEAALSTCKTKKVCTCKGNTITDAQCGMDTPMGAPSEAVQLALAALVTLVATVVMFA
jgi:hypothetical protein